MEESQEQGDPLRWRQRYSWAELMKRVFLVDMFEKVFRLCIVILLLSTAASLLISGFGWPARTDDLLKGHPIQLTGAPAAEANGYTTIYSVNPKNP